MSAVMSAAEVSRSSEISAPSPSAVKLPVPRVDGVFLVGCLSSSLAVDLQEWFTGVAGVTTPAAASVLLMRSTASHVTVSPGESGQWTVCPSAALGRLQPGSARAVIVVPGVHVLEWQRCFRETRRLVETGVRRVLLVLPDCLRMDGSGAATAAEDLFVESLGCRGVQLTVLRLGRVLHPSRGSAGWTQCLEATLPAQFTVTCLRLRELVEILEGEVFEQGSADVSDGEYRQRVLSIPGVRRSCAEAVFDAVSESNPGMRIRRLTAGILRSVGVGWLLAGVLRVLSLVLPGVRDRLTGTMRPRVLRDLVSLCNRHTGQHIQLAGCNHGVNHFGWKFPGKTVLCTTSVPGRIRVHKGLVTVDAGVTLKAVMDRLAADGRELPVTPNFSWISMGTVFFVPVHGSGSRMSTLGDAISRVLLYDWEHGRFFAADRGDRLFEEAMYNRQHPWLLLRMTLVTQPMTACELTEKRLEDPGAEQLLEQFADAEASHVEIRKSRATDSGVMVRSWRISGSAGGSAAPPRDRIGRIWDRLEETPIASSLFHWFVRTFAFHVELFLTADEFRVFWARHRSLPLSKIQLRRMRRDGMKHSACCTEDRISVDLFMLRGNRDVFCRFVSEELPDARSNPGKQSF